MTKELIQSITCDACQCELITHSHHPAKYSLELTAINTNVNLSNSTFAVCVHPPIKAPVHFCSFKCLSDWVNNKEYIGHQT